MVSFKHFSRVVFLLLTLAVGSSGLQANQVHPATATNHIDSKTSSSRDRNVARFVGILQVHDMGGRKVITIVPDENQPDLFPFTIPHVILFSPQQDRIFWQLFHGWRVDFRLVKDEPIDVTPKV